MILYKKIAQEKLDFMELYISGTQEFFNLDGLSFVPATRQERIHRYVKTEDKARCLVAGLLLRRFCGVTSETQLAYGSNGKPYLKDGTFYFNLSHSGDYVVLATSTKEIGVDVEKIEPYSDSVAKRCFTPPEYKWLKQERNIEAFYRLWTAKESVMKGTGLGFSLPPEDFCVLPLDESAHHIGRKTWFFDWIPYNEHMVCRAAVCAEEKTEVIPVAASALI